QGFLYELSPLETDANWRPGRFVKAEITNPHATPRSAVAIPSTAVLYHQGRALVYVHLGTEKKDKETLNTYERREIQILGQQGDLLIASDGVKTGEAVVVNRAQ